MSKFTGVCEVVTMDLNRFNKNILSKGRKLDSPKTSRNCGTSTTILWQWLVHIPQRTHRHPPVDSGILPFPGWWEVNVVGMFLRCHNVLDDSESI